VGVLVVLKRAVLAVLCGLVAGLAAAAPASAGPGGAFASDPAAISAVDCVAGCAAVDAAQPGSLLRIRGRSMAAVEQIVFLGGPGDADDATAKISRQRRRSVDVVVPAQALSGRLRAVNGDGARSQASRATVAIQRGAGGRGPLDVRVVGRQVFYAASRPARVDVLARRPLSATVALVRLADGALVASWPLGPLVPGVVRTVTWDGAIGGLPQPAGRYEFRALGDASAQAAQAAQAGTALAPLASAAFDLVDHKFPVRGKHEFGTGIAAFGAQRDGHVHEGQDVFADCGTPLVAARGGIVKLNQHDANAGNYLVIDGAGTDVDYAYMHLRRPSPLAKGAPVMTGEAIGEVGDTGDADGCHLHFEMWTGPGWYTGGAPIDPLGFLQAWDAYS
jgi:murein DD-endopeptidase MepM/ murein hydrolase activator NlpD